MLKQILGFFITVVGLIGMAFNVIAIIAIMIVKTKAIFLLFEKKWTLGLSLLLLTIITGVMQWEILMKVDSVIAFFMGIGMILSGNSRRNY